MGAIEVKREVNSKWVIKDTDDDDPHAESLLCPELLPISGGVDIRLKPGGSSDNKTAESVVDSVAMETCTTSSNSESTESSTDEESKSPLPPLLSPIQSPPSPSLPPSSTTTTVTTEMIERTERDIWMRNSPIPPTRKDEKEEPPLGLFEEFEKDEVEEDDDEEEEEEEEDEDDETMQKSEDEKSSSSPGVVDHMTETSPIDSFSSLQTCDKTEVCGSDEGREGGSVSSNGVSPVTVGEKRKRGRETEEEYEMRRLARRESLKFVLDFCKLRLTEKATISKFSFLCPTHSPPLALTLVT